MRISLILLSLSTAGALFAEGPTVIDAAQVSTNTLITSKRTPTAEAPVFGTGSWFRKVLNPESPRIELRPPVRLSEFITGDKLELSLRSFTDLVLANNTDIQIQRLSVETPR